jgi:membrane protein DedA with SNARE-associated domain
MFAYSGGLVWVLTFVSLGYFLGDQWSRIDQEIHGILLWITIAAAAAALAYWWLRRRRSARP